MITHQQMRQFLAVVDSGNFTRAADALGVTQPTLSSGIRELEAKIGAKLFERERPSVRLTSSGNRLLPIARKIVREFQRAEQEVARVPTTSRPFLLGIAPSISTKMLEIACANWTAGQLALVEREGASLRRELREGRLDAALVLSRDIEPDGLQFYAIYEEPLVLMLPKGHKLAGRESISAEELADETMIARRSCESLIDTSRFFTARGVRPNFSYKSHNDDKAMAMVAAGMGITVAPVSFRRAEVAAVELVDFDVVRRVALAVRSDDYALGGQYCKHCDAVIERFREGSRPLMRA